MLRVTSITLFNDAIGLRMSATYSEVDETTGQITADNKRVDRVVTDADSVQSAGELFALAQSLVEGK